MSTHLVIKEIQRFLASDRPEVLCVRGRWGVGKTFAWRRYLDEGRKAGKLKSQDYAYVSLFGLNSLDDLRYAIFESTVPPDRLLTGPTADTFGALVSKAQTIGRKSRSWLGPALSSVGLGEVGNALSRSAFLLVRDQLICLDDLERAGDDLKPRDVLGMVSFLKEQRNCRVALLLNDEAMEGNDQAEFRRLLEKVIDVSLTFAPTAHEAAEIAVTEDAPVGTQLRLNVEALGITNIRVIKKIERLALRLEELLRPYRSEVLNQAVAACVLGGWAVFEPDQAPSLEFIREYNAIIVAMRDRENDPMPEIVRWRDKLAALPFSHTDDFDQVVLDGVAVGYFDENRLSTEAQVVERTLNHNGRDNSFSKAWSLYENSLAMDDDAVLDALQQGALENLETIDPVNINAAVTLLRGNGRENQADELVQAYVAVQPEDPRFFDLHNHHFMDIDAVDPALRRAFEMRHALFEDKRDPRAVLLEIAKGEGWNDEDERLLSKLSPSLFEALIEDTEGAELRRLVQKSLRMAAHGGPNTEGMRISLHEALTRIAAKSPLRARRLRTWGFVAPPAAETATVPPAADRG
jgi:hypothetical protein